MKPRVKALSLAAIASLGLMGGCKKGSKIENPNAEVTSIIGATAEPTIYATLAPTAEPTATPTIEPTPTPTIEPTPTPESNDRHISLVGEIDYSSLKEYEYLIIEPYVHMFVWSGQNASNVELEDGWTNSNIYIPTFPNYGYCGFALDEKGNYIWMLTNLDTVTKKFDPENDFFTQDILLDEETKRYETLNRMVSFTPGKLYEESHEFDYYEEMYSDNFYEPYEHLIYYISSANDMFDQKGNLTIEIPQGYDIIVAAQVPNTEKAIMILTNYAPVLVLENNKEPGKVLEKDKELTLHI